MNTTEGEDRVNDQKSWDSRQGFAQQVNRITQIFWNIGFLAIGMALFLGAFNPEFEGSVKTGFIIAFALMLFGFGGGVDFKGI